MLRLVGEVFVKSLIYKTFGLGPGFVWITLLIAAPPWPPEPEKSRAWLECPQKGHCQNPFKINDLRSLWVL
jgi:hypothetical protein